MLRPRPSAVPLVLAAMLAAGSAVAAESTKKDVGNKLQNVEHAIEQDKARAGALGEQSAAIAQEIENLRQQTIAAARTTQAQEQDLTDLEGTLDELRAAEEEKTAKLSARSAQLATTLGALERMALYPPEAVAALPESPVDTARSALLLRTAVPEIESRAASLRNDLESLRSLREQMTRERDAIAAGKQKLEADREKLAALVSRKSALYRQTEAERRQAEDRVAKLSTQATDLKDLLDKIDAEGQARREALARATPAPPPRAAASSGGAEKLASLPPGQPSTIRPMTGAEGQLALPARGEIIRQFGDPGDFGTTSKGITIRTRPGAQVVAPYDGQVVFAGPFRGYGQILIIEHREGYHTLLSGLSRVDAVAGQWVLAGEPVGLVGQRDSQAPELYVELRRNGRPVNPLPWLALHNGKVSG